MPHRQFRQKLYASYEVIFQEMVDIWLTFGFLNLFLVNSDIHFTLWTVFQWKYSVRKYCHYIYQVSFKVTIWITLNTSHCERTQINKHTKNSKQSEREELAYVHQYFLCNILYSESFRENKTTWGGGCFEVHYYSNCEKNNNNRENVNQQFITKFAILTVLLLVTRKMIVLFFSSTWYAYCLDNICRSYRLTNPIFIW